MVAMHEFDDLDILLRRTLTDEAELAQQPSECSWDALRSRVKRRRSGCTRTIVQLIGTCYVVMDAMLLRGTHEPIYRIPLESRLLSQLCFIM